MPSPGMYGRLGKVPRRTKSNRTVHPPTAGSPSQLTDLETYTGTGTSHSWKIPSNATAGDLVMCAISVQGSGQIDTVPAGWTLEASVGPLNLAAQYLYSRKIDGTEDYTDTFTTSAITAVAAAWWGVKANGASLSLVKSSAWTQVTDPVDPSAVSVPSAGDYWVFPCFWSNRGESDGTLSSGYDLLVSLVEGGSTPNATLYLQKALKSLTSTEDPGAFGWVESGPGRTRMGYTLAVAATGVDPDVAEFDHTHVEADVTDLDHTDADAIHDNVSGEIAAITAKASPVSGDFLMIEDSEASNAKKRITIGDLPVGGGGGSTVPEWMELLAASGSAHADNQEFTGTIGGTAVTPTGTVTWTQDNGVLSATFEDQSSGDHCPRLYALTPSAAPVTIEARMTYLSLQGSNPMVGLCFTDGTTAASNAVAIGLYEPGPVLARWAGTLTSMTTTNIATNPSDGVGVQWVFVRLIWTAANTFAFALSPTGADGSWTDFSTAAWAATLTPTHFGVFVSSWSQTFLSAASFEYLRVVEADLSV